MHCRGCGSPRIDVVVDLGDQPLSDEFPLAESPGPDPRWPLRLSLCADCTLVQLAHVSVPEPAPMSAVESATSLAHAVKSVRQLLESRPELAGGTYHEFASHHGGRWDAELRAQGLRPAVGGEPASLVVEVHALAHEPDLAPHFATYARLLREDGLLVIEFHHLLPLVLGNQFDTIRHGHWVYLSLEAVSRLAVGHGLAVVDVVEAEIYGGSLQVVLAPLSASRPRAAAVDTMRRREEAAGLATAQSLGALHAGAVTVGAELSAFLRDQRGAGRLVLGYGAPSKAAVLLGVSGVTRELLAATADASPAKHGRVIPGARVPICSVGELLERRPDDVLVLTWDIVDEVIADLRERGGPTWAPRYVVPSPHLRVLG